MSSKISANRRLEELSNDNERQIDERDECAAAWFFANKQLKMEIQIEALEDEVQDLEDERDDKDEEIEKLKEENKELKEANDKFKCAKCKGHHTGCSNPTCDTCVEELKEENLELRLAVRRNQDEIDRLREILG